jgi:hypothetical protein
MNAKEFLERDLKDSQGLSFACWKYGLSDAIIELMEEYAKHKLASDGVLADVVGRSEQLCQSPSHHAMEIGLQEKCIKCGAES